MIGALSIFLVLSLICVDASSLRHLRQRDNSPNDRQSGGVFIDIGHIPIEQPIVKTEPEVETKEEVQDIEIDQEDLEIDNIDYPTIDVASIDCAYLINFSKDFGSVKWVELTTVTRHGYQIFMLGDLRLRASVTGYAELYDGKWVYQVMKEVNGKLKNIRFDVLILTCKSDCYNGAGTGCWNQMRFSYKLVRKGVETGTLHSRADLFDKDCQIYSKDGSPCGMFSVDLSMWHSGYPVMRCYNHDDEMEYKLIRGVDRNVSVIVAEDEIYVKYLRYKVDSHMCNKKYDPATEYLSRVTVETRVEDEQNVPSFEKDYMYRAKACRLVSGFFHLNLLVQLTDAGVPDMYENDNQTPRLISTADGVSGFCSLRVENYTTDTGEEKLRYVIKKNDETVKAYIYHVVNAGGASLEPPCLYDDGTRWNVELVDHDHVSFSKPLVMKKIALDANFNYPIAFVACSSPVV